MVLFEVKYMSFRILWVKLNYGRVKVCITVYDPTKGDGEDKGSELS